MKSSLRYRLCSCIAWKMSEASSAVKPRRASGPRQLAVNPVSAPKHQHVVVVVGFYDLLQSRVFFPAQDIPYVVGRQSGRVIVYRYSLVHVFPSGTYLHDARIGILRVIGDVMLSGVPLPMSQAYTGA